MPLVVLLGYVPEAAPWLWDILPAQLETFCCRDDMAIFFNHEWTPVECVEELTDYISGATALKEMTLKLQEVGWPESCKAKVQNSCDAAGVACHIIDAAPLSWRRVSYLREHAFDHYWMV